VLRRRLRLSAAAVAGLLIAASAAVLGVPPTSAAPVEDPVIDVTIDSFAPVAPAPGQQVRITGRITNTSSETFQAPQALACIDRERLATNAGIAAISTEQDLAMNDRNSCERLTTAESGVFQQFPEPLAPKQSVQFSLTVPWNEWQISRQTGAYVVGVVFRGQPEDKSRITAGRARTLMPVVGDQPLTRKVNTALVIPLRHRPTQLGGAKFANDSLAQSMAPNGQLGRLLAAGKNRRVTWLVDPAMLDEARRIEDGYVVAGNNNQTTPGTGQQVVAAWLKEFEASRARGNQVVLLPYGDPDVASLIDASDAGVEDPLSLLVSDARAASEKYILAPGSTVPPAFTNGLWLENGSARSRYLGAASTGFPGSRETDLNLVNSAAWVSAERPSLNPSPVYNVLTPESPRKVVRTVIANSSLTAGGPDPETAASPLQVRQRFAAETALMATGGTTPVSVVALPPRTWDADGLATTALAADLALPWIAPTDVSQIVAATPKPPTTKAPSAPRSNPALTSSQVDAVKQLHDATVTFRDLLTVKENLDENIKRALLRSTSNGWRGFPDEAKSFTAIETGSVNQQLQKVHLVNSSVDQGLRREIKVNLAGSQGTFPLTITNELSQSVRVGVVVTPANRTDLRIAPLQTLILPPKQKATFRIQASAEQNGLIKANAQVITASQRPVGNSQELLIEAAQYGSVGWVLVGAAIALLFGTSFVRIYRRIRTERRNPAPAGPTNDPLHPAPLAAEADEPGDLPEPRANDVPEATSGAPETLKEGVGSKDG
jgi:hypothetical protein